MDHNRQHLDFGTIRLYKLCSKTPFHYYLNLEKKQYYSYSLLMDRAKEPLFVYLTNSYIYLNK